MTTKDVVLVGGGHTHVQVLRQHGMRPFPARITVVVDQPVAVYSGMVPGMVAGQYQRHQLEIDVRPLARRAGARVMHGRALKIDAKQKLVHIEGRPPLRYDIASVNIGSTVAGLDTPGVREHGLATRPISVLVTEIEERLKTLGDHPIVTVVGAGAGGVELAFCLDNRLRDSGRIPIIQLVFSGERVLSDRQNRISEAVHTAAKDREIQLFPKTRVTEVRGSSVVTDGGELKSDLTVWVTGAHGLSFGRESGLPVDPRDFIQVRDDLRVLGVEDLFAAGDCAVPESWPDIPKAGVYAVREGPVLADNLRALLTGSSLRPYRPQRDFFSILNLGDGTAIGAKWGVPLAGPWVMRWKDRIDKLFMDKFQVLDPDGVARIAFLKGMPEMAEMEMVCGGCAAKVGQTSLSRALSRLHPGPPDPMVMLGVEAADDVVAWRTGEEVLVQNLDAFTAFTDDPYVVGVAAANNATSDLWCRGVQPRVAMAMVTVPDDARTEETLFQVMSGVRLALDADGVTLLGGHTTVGDTLLVGLAVTGHGSPRWTRDGASPGEHLLLTRALGTGALFHADAAGRSPGPAVQSALDGMIRGNGPASRALVDTPVSAITDVTGFGLAGHLAELLRASEISATVSAQAIPLLPGVANLLAAGERSTFHEQTREILKALRVDSAVAGVPGFEVLFDPQTVGGLLLTTSDPDTVEAHLAAAGLEAFRIGITTEKRPDGAVFEVVP